MNKSLPELTKLNKKTCIDGSNEISKSSKLIDPVWKTKSVNWNKSTDSIQQELLQESVLKESLFTFCLQWFFFAVFLQQAYLDATASTLDLHADWKDVNPKENKIEIPKNNMCKNCFTV